MSEEKPFQFNRGFQGCSVALLYIVVFKLSISLVCIDWLGLISGETQRVLNLFIYLSAICLGGYVAARLGKTTGWTNSLVVGLLAELFLASRLPNEGPDELFVDLKKVMNDPGAHWRPLVGLALTIPAAILGGVIWQKTGGFPSNAKGQSEVVNKTEPAEE
ncbi:MAG: hypothetical protein ACKO0N_00600 [Planctomycetota bacterium]